MNKKSRLTAAAVIIASAIIWAAVIIGCSSALKDTECYDSIKNILVGGVLAHIILVWAPETLILRKSRENVHDNDTKD